MDKISVVKGIYQFELVAKHIEKNKKMRKRIPSSSTKSSEL